MNRTTLCSFALATFAIGCGGSSASTSRPAAASPSMKEQVRALIESIETGDRAAIAYVHPEKYIQHNLGVGDGLAGFAEVLHHLPEGSARAKPVRVFRDGDFVFTHSEYNFFGPKIGFDIFRYENGKIVEHWDNLQEIASDPNPNGHTMIDGPTEVTDLEKTEDNKALVRSFLEDVFINGHIDRMASYFDGDRYVQHNPHVGDGLSGIQAAFRMFAERGMTMEYSRIHRVLGEGNFVLVVGEGAFGGQPTAFYDLFRIENGKLAEHWDVLQPIPPRAEWKNDNGKF